MAKAKRKRRGKQAAGKETSLPASPPASSPAEPIASRRRASFRLLLGCIVAVAFLLRVGVGLELQANYLPVRDPAEATDMYTYQEFARQILDGDYNWSQGFYYQPFYYAAFLPAVYGLLGASSTSVILAQAMLGSASVWLIGIAFGRTFGRRPALAAAVLLALSRFHIFYTPFTLIAVLQSFWLALIFFLAVDAWHERRRWWWWVWAGLACGAGNATRGNLILLLPLLLAAAAWQWRRRPKLAGAAVVVLLLAFQLPQLPFSLLNWRAHGRWVGPSSAASAVLALGNTPEAPPGGREPQLGSGPMDYPRICLEWSHQEQAEGVPVTTNIRRWAVDEPLAFLELKLRMLLLYWHRTEVPNNVSIIHHDGRPVGSRLLFLPVLLDFLVLGSFGLAGMVLALRYHFRRPRVWLGAGFIAIYCGSIVMFYVLARFRVPMLPLLAGFGGVLLARFGRSWDACKRRGRAGPLLATLGVWLVCFLFVGWGYDVYRHRLEPLAMRLARPRGTEVTTREGTFVFDYGPMTFGGWHEVPMSNLTRIEKRFLVDDAAPVDRFRRLRFPVSTATGGSFRFIPEAPEHPERFRRVVEVSEGMHWLELPALPVATSKGTPTELTFVFTLEASPASDLAVVFDRQRDYGRTETGGDPPPDPGELVIEARTIPLDGRAD